MSFCSLVFYCIASWAGIDRAIGVKSATAPSWLWRVLDELQLASPSHTLVLSLPPTLSPRTHSNSKSSFPQSCFLKPRFPSPRFRGPGSPGRILACLGIISHYVSNTVPWGNTVYIVSKPTLFFSNKPLLPLLWIFSLFKFPLPFWLYFCFWHLFFSCWPDIGPQDNSHEKFISLETVKCPPLNRSASKNSACAYTSPFYLSDIHPSASSSLPFREIATH